MNLSISEGLDSYEDFSHPASFFVRTGFVLPKLELFVFYAMFEGDRWCTSKLRAGAGFPCVFLMLDPNDACFYCKAFNLLAGDIDFLLGVN